MKQERKRKGVNEPSLGKLVLFPPWEKVTFYDIFHYQRRYMDLTTKGYAKNKTHYIMY